MAQVSKNHTKSFTILVAEDDPAISDVMVIILEEEGYKVHAIHEYDQILEKVVGGSIDLVFLDVRLSGRDGSEICKQLKADNKTKHTPVILLSASVDIEAIAQTVHADDVLQKPFEITDLLAKVKKYQQN